MPIPINGPALKDAIEIELKDHPISNRYPAGVIGLDSPLQILCLKSVLYNELFKQRAHHTLGSIKPLIVKILDHLNETNSLKKFTSTEADWVTKTIAPFLNNTAVFRGTLSEKDFRIKILKELFSACGPATIKEMHERADNFFSELPIKRTAHELPSDFVMHELFRLITKSANLLLAAEFLGLLKPLMPKPFASNRAQLWSQIIVLLNSTPAIINTTSTYKRVAETVNSWLICQDAAKLVSLSLYFNQWILTRPKTTSIGTSIRFFFSLGICQENIHAKLMRNEAMTMLKKMVKELYAKQDLKSIERLLLWAESIPLFNQHRNSGLHFGATNSVLKIKQMRTMLIVATAPTARA